MIDFDEWKEAKECMHLLNSKRKLEANKKIIEALDYILNNGSEIMEMWASIIEAAGFYPYLQKYKEKFKINDTASLITKEFFSSKYMSNIYFHEEQKEIINRIELGKNMIISAPTSFGKSLLIEEVVASKKYKNIVIIQPTLALLDETRKKLSRYMDCYKLIVHTSQESSLEQNNIFLYTAERVLEYKNFPPIEFLILDEFYKLSKQRDDERSDLLNNAFHKILKEHHCKFMLLGPNIEDISYGFSQKYAADFFKTNYSLVINKEIDIYKEYSDKFGDRGKKQKFKQKILFDLLFELREQPTLVFCSSPNRVRILSKAYVDYLKARMGNGHKDLPLIEWIEKNVNANWSLIDLLENSVGVHNGAIPKHIISSILDYFLNGDLSCIFCTTTIVEGVNTCAKNIIYFDKKKGNNIPIDYFDYCNIKGRAGRMMSYMIGNIYNFNEPPKPTKTVVDIPFYEQENISDEILIHLDEEEMKYPKKEQNQHILNMPVDIKNIFKRNGVLVRGQERILNELMKEENYTLINWSGMPSYRQLEFVLKLAWENLSREGETIKPMTFPKLVKMTFDYGNGSSLKEMIVRDYNYRITRESTNLVNQRDVWDLSIQSVFQIFRHWFQYKIPKWIRVVNSIQEYVCMRQGKVAGNYVYYANLIENDSVPENMAFLLECNIPSSTVKKIIKFVPKTAKDQELVDYILDNKIYKNNNLMKYERQLIVNNLISSNK